MARASQSAAARATSDAAKRPAPTQAQGAQSAHPGLMTVVALAVVAAAVAAAAWMAGLPAQSGFASSTNAASSDRTDAPVAGDPSADTLLASSTIALPWTVHNVACVDEYKPAVPGCTPAKCARIITDELCSADEAIRLRSMASRVMALGGGGGAPTILDLHTGALSKGSRFVNVYASLTAPRRAQLFPRQDLALYTEIKDRIRAAIMKEFGLQQLFLTKPTFFSRIDGSKTAATLNDEYWHVHVDRTTYGSFVYTSLLYLSDFGVDFEGGEFAFVAEQDGTPLKHEQALSDDDGGLVTSALIQPRLGRVSMFTSGPENPHHIRKVTKGIRFALTVSFTCDPTAAIADPSPS
ncbi:hypothetical protein CAOG_08965, partial [Capsaspora owczarzaki ATCC 30864]